MISIIIFIIIIVHSPTQMESKSRLCVYNQ